MMQGDHIVGMGKVLPLLSLLAVSGCAIAETRWEKVGADDRTAANDLAVCRGAAQREAFEISPYYGPYYSLPWHVRPWYAYGGGTFYTESRLTDFCMRNKGYQLVTIQPPQTRPPASAPTPTTDK